MRRSSRKGVALAKAKAKAYIDYLDAPDHKVLSGALPPVSEKVIRPKKFNVQKDRGKPGKRITLALQRTKRQNPLQMLQLGPSTRHILFMNVGDERIFEAVRWLSSGGPQPAWTNNVKGLEARQGTLYLSENGRSLPFALKEDKRRAVKTQYFDPKKQQLFFFSVHLIV